nr:unnamed protein product [Digitaria exilis]
MHRRRAGRSRNHLPAAACFLLLGAVVTVAGDAASGAPAIVATVCGATQTPNPEAFDVSFVTTMEMIYQNVTRSGFGSGSGSGSGTGSNSTVFGLGQCLAYLSPTDCQLCYAQSRVKLPHCLPADAGRIYLDGCFLRYGARNFTADAVDASDTAVCNATGGQPEPGFAAAAAALVGNVTEAAPGAKDYYYASSSESAAPAAYAAAQCWRSLNASACAACVASARDRVLRQCLPGAAEGYGLNAGCVVRYSTRPFYLAADTGGGGGDGSSSRHIVIIVIASVFTALAVIGIAFVWTKMRSRRDGLHDDGREVAVKRLFFNTRQWADQFFNEVKLVSQVQHKNLVKLLGCSVEGPESLLVYEYLCNTSLDHYLFEYIVHGQLTEKADIYSYGVLVLEIVTGRKNHNSVASSSEGLSLMALIWKHYNAGTLMELLDPNLHEQCSEEEAIQVFHIGLLCAQASPNVRPPMWKVVEMLSSKGKLLPRPTQPPFINVKGSSGDSSGSVSLMSNSDKSPFSLNQLSVSGMQAR